MLRSNMAKALRDLDRADEATAVKGVDQGVVVRLVGVDPDAGD